MIGAHSVYHSHYANMLHAVLCSHPRLKRSLKGNVINPTVCCLLFVVCCLLFLAWGHNDAICFYCFYCWPHRNTYIAQRPNAFKPGTQRFFSFVYTRLFRFLWFMSTAANPLSNVLYMRLICLL
jgi:hypothetical protein